MTRNEKKEKGQERKRTGKKVEEEEGTEKKREEGRGEKKRKGREGVRGREGMEEEGRKSTIPPSPYVVSQIPFPQQGPVTAEERKEVLPAAGFSCRLES